MLEFLYVVLVTFFVIMLIITAFSIGTALIIWFVALSCIFAAYALLRDRWRRWQFLHNAKTGEGNKSVHIIDAQYEEIRDDK